VHHGCNPQAGDPGFFDEPTNTVSYLVWDPATKESAVIDPVLNFDHRNGNATVESADAMLAEANKFGVKIAKILETHAHAVLSK
jgi:glyoxylase-like metal-dependent hydrolase (beta-lactamase superfamily II)